ncbi:MAG: hypothetical protein GF353_08795 [Candidatus Lokiarchaeota archaeon]|nr:hypothetical protein [Candidatus Lokiarchaeota archaeon]
MINIKGVWILDREGSFIFNFERFIQGSEEYDAMLLSNLMPPIIKFAKNNQQKELDFFETDNDRVLVSIDNTSRILYILLYDKNFDDQSVIEIRNRLNEVCAKYYKNYYDSQDENRKTILSSIKKEIERIIKIDPNQSINNILKDI